MGVSQKDLLRLRDLTLSDNGEIPDPQDAEERNVSMSPDNAIW